MPETPIFAFRLPKADQALLAEMANVYGAPNARAFLKEMIQVMLGGDGERLRQFNIKLAQGIGKHLGDQMALKLNGPLEGVDTPAKEDASKPRKPRSARTARKKRRKRGRRT